MMILVTYDVNTEDQAGKKRLRQVARACEDVGQRVQNSVFECLVSPSEYLILKEKLRQIMDEEKDSLRFYRLGKNWQVKLETMGKDDSYDPENDAFIF
ncbi:MAG: CRISPR-associated endonuclease Cas2 [Tissierellia bacterium]|nr:CRISPR-associated endonuclease Cas2 [Tissierellia bacterium]